MPTAQGISQPARSAVTSSEVESGSRVVFTADLFNALPAPTAAVAMSIHRSAGSTERK